TTTRQDRRVAPERSSPGRSRRDFLRAGAGLGLAVAGTTLLGGVGELTAWADGQPIVAVPFSSDLYASPKPPRFSPILEQAPSHGIKYVGGPPVQVRFRPPGGAWRPFSKLRLDTEGLPKGRGVYRTELVFDQAGKWKAEAKVSGRTTSFTLGL